MRNLTTSFPFSILALVFSLVLSSSPPSVAAQEGTVELSLDQYLALVDQAKQAEEAAQEGAETLATLTEQRLTLRLETVEAGQILAQVSFQVEVRGDVAEGSVSLPLPFPAMVDRGTVTATRPAQAGDGVAAALHRDPAGTSGPILVVRRQGSYRVELSGRLPLPTVDDAAAPPQIPLGRARAAITEAVLDLPAELRGEVHGAVMVNEEEAGDRRRLRLALHRDQEGSARLLRATESAEETALARTVVVTTVEVSRGGIRRRDLVGYEVLRGGLETLRLTLPQNYGMEALRSDEGELFAPLFVQSRPDGLLEIPRERRLTRKTGVGRLRLSSAPLPAAAVDLSLAPVRPEVKTRARYLLLAAAVPTEAEPLPADSWVRVDVADLGSSLESWLPEATVVWRWSGEEADPAAADPKLRLAPLPAAEAHPLRIVRRETTSLLTVDGTLVHRDRLQVAGLSGLYGVHSTLQLTLPGQARLWSATVDGVAVRPLEKGGKLTLPLLGGEAYGILDGPEVEVVSVEEQAIAPGRSLLDLDLPTVELPVVEHRWQLLLPEGNRYRYAGGSLRPAPLPESYSAARVTGMRIGGVTEGQAGVEGQVTADDGSPLPGVLVGAGGRTTFTNAEGRYLLVGLSPGPQAVRFLLEGFNGVERKLVLQHGKITRIDTELSLAAVTEEIVVTGRTPTFGRALTDKDLEDAREADAQYQYQQNISVLNQGTVGGVRPLPVEIPETGKGLFLAAALPPAAVTARLEVKRKR